MSSKPNVLLILTDQLRYPPPYESSELRGYRHEHCGGQERLRQNGVSFARHYPMAAACAPSRASLLTGHYPSLHGVTQTDGISKSADNPEEMFWLAPDTVPTLGDWFRAGGYRTYFKGKWHASHAYLDAEDGEGFLLSIDDDGNPLQENIERYLAADLLDDFGFSEWVGPEPHGLGAHNTGTVKDPFTADETIALLKRLDAEETDDPWLTVCSFLNPHDDSLFGIFALTQGLRFHPSEVPHVDQAPTHDEDLSTKPSCQQSYVDTWKTVLAPQPWIETHLKFYYQMQAAVGEQITRVLDALQASEAYENTIVVFSSDHGDMQGRARGDARKVARRLRRGAAGPVHRLQPAVARRPSRARDPDQPRRSDSHAARAHRDRPRRGARQARGRSRRCASAGRARPVRRDPCRRARRAVRAGPVYDR